MDDCAYRYNTSSSLLYIGGDMEKLKYNYITQKACQNIVFHILGFEKMCWYTVKINFKLTTHPLLFFIRENNFTLQFIYANLKYVHV